VSFTFAWLYPVTHHPTQDLLPHLFVFLLFVVVIVVVFVGSAVSTGVVPPYHGSGSIG
jgi:hypothetical protein